MMAAISAAESGYQVDLFEQKSNLGSKLLITGGRRCNLTSAVSETEFLERLIGPSRFVRPALSALSQKDLRAFFEKRGVTLKTEGLKVYPVSDDARDVLKCLKQALSQAGVRVILNEPVHRVIMDETQVKGIETDHFQAYERVIVATGGVSYSVTGSDGKLLASMKEIGRNEWRAGLSSLHTKNDFSPLMGISLADVVLSHGNTYQRGELLFTHYGLSGPAALDLSNHLSGLDLPLEIRLDLLPDMSREALADRLFGTKKDLDKRLAGLLPKRLLQYLLEPYHDKDPANFKKTEREQMIDWFKAHKVTIKGFGQLEQAIVSLGGVDLKQIKSKTLEHRTIKGLYFAGECLDIAGPTGGYNLQLAFSTGYLAGRMK